MGEIGGHLHEGAVAEDHVRGQPGGVGQLPAQGAQALEETGVVIHGLGDHGAGLFPGLKRTHEFLLTLQHRPPLVGQAEAAVGDVLLQ